MDNTIETTQQIEVSFDGVKMKDFFAYWDAFRKGDWSGQHKFYALVVRQWSYDLDPSNPESYPELELNQYIATQIAIRTATQKVGKEIGYS